MGLFVACGTPSRALSITSANKAVGQTLVKQVEGTTRLLTSDKNKLTSFDAITQASLDLGAEDDVVASPNGHRVLRLAEGELVDTLDGRVVARHQGKMAKNAVGFSPSGDIYALVGQEPNLIDVFKSDTGTKIARLQTKLKAALGRNILLSQDGATLVVLTLDKSSAFEVFDVISGKLRTSSDIELIKDPYVSEGAGLWPYSISRPS